jgi:hypothetical protein
MLKTISAALLASVLAAPAFAAGQATNRAASTTPVIKAEQVKQAKQAKPNLLNANAKMGRHHVRHASHHRAHHKHIAALKTHKFSKASTRHVTPATKRG